MSIIIFRNLLWISWAVQKELCREIRHSALTTRKSCQMYSEAAAGLAPEAKDRVVQISTPKLYPR
jgi:hypothetical protein